jgi:hypothetical protein
MYQDWQHFIVWVAGESDDGRNVQVLNAKIFE